MKIVVATQNIGKLKELRQLLEPHGVEVEGLDCHREIVLPAESLPTYAGNAAAKAWAVARTLSLPALGDDSGLEVDILGGLPGIHSATFGGGSRKNIEKLLNELEAAGPGKRTARFRCTLAFVYPVWPSSDWREVLFEGTMEGEIATEPRGKGGFGYDPVFLVPSLGKTVAELSDEEKNAISHRAAATRKLIEFLKTLMVDDKLNKRYY